MYATPDATIISKLLLCFFASLDPLDRSFPMMNKLKAFSMEEVRRKGNNLGLVPFLFVLSVVLCAVLYAPRVFVHVPYLRSTTDELVSVNRPSSPAAAGVSGSNNNDNIVLDNQVESPCSSMREDSICCDRSDLNTDVCFMAGDVRTDAASMSLLLFPPKPPAHHNGTAAHKKEESEEQKIVPYPRKMDRFSMQRIHEVRLRRPNETEKHQNSKSCDVRHDAPLLVMTAGGYSGNFFHAFRDGFVPAWLTAQHLRRRVVLGVLSYNPCWAGTYGRIISGLSDYDVVDLVRDTRTHCFPGAIVGSRFHGILAVEPARLRDNKTVVDFNDFLAKAFNESTTGGSDNGDHDHHRRIGSNGNNQKTTNKKRRPRLGIVSRKGTRVIENQAAVVELARSVGFDVDVLETASGAPPLPAMFAAVRACDALVGVHGADLTRFLFLRPGRASSFTQIAPLGISSIARNSFGNPATRMGLHYEQYEVRASESSLSRSYAPDDVVIADPEEAKKTQGYTFVAQVYLKGQNVTLDLDRFRQTLMRMHAHALPLLQDEQSDKQEHKYL